MILHEQLERAFDDIIEGRTVKRSRHELTYYGVDVTEQFIASLHRHGYRPGTVNATTVEPGWRIPSFYIKDQTAYFGWVFWEKFSQLRLRKLFGTVIRNTKGDWLITLPSNSTDILFINSTHVVEMDIDRPFEL